MLPFGDERMLERVVRLIAPLVDPIVVVAAADQQPPDLPRQVTVTHDRRAGRGPLEGLAAGLTAIADRADVVYATSCDVPLLAPAFVSRMFELLGDDPVGDRGIDNCDADNWDIVVPRDGKFHQPL